MVILMHFCTTGFPLNTKMPFATAVSGENYSTLLLILRFPVPAHEIISAMPLSKNVHSSLRCPLTESLDTIECISGLGVIARMKSCACARFHPCNYSELIRAITPMYSVGCAVRLETRRSRVQPPPRSATFFRGD